MFCLAVRSRKCRPGCCAAESAITPVSCAVMCPVGGVVLPGGPDAQDPGLNTWTGGVHTWTCVPPPAAEPQSLFEPPADLPARSYAVARSYRSACWSGRQRDAASRPPVHPVSAQNSLPFQHPSRLPPGEGGTARPIPTHLIVRVAPPPTETGRAVPHIDAVTSAIPFYSDVAASVRFVVRKGKNDVAVGESSISISAVAKILLERSLGHSRDVPFARES